MRCIIFIYNLAIRSVLSYASAKLSAVFHSHARFRLQFEGTGGQIACFSMCRSLRAYTARQLSQHAARVMDSQGQPPAEGRDSQDVFLDLMSQVLLPSSAIVGSRANKPLHRIGQRNEATARNLARPVMFEELLCDALVASSRSQSISCNVLTNTTVS